MNKQNLFIRRPYLAMVLAITITLCGALAILVMPVSQYPDITPPQVNISVVYPGADAKTLLDTVVIPIEDQVNGVEDMIYLSSTAGNTGQASITASFKIGTDPQTAKQNVQDRVDWASPSLPPAVQNEGIIVREQTGNILLTIALTSPGGTYSSEFLANYASINLEQPLKRISGVSQIAIFGGSDYAMRIWLDEHKMTGLGISSGDITSALEDQNIQVTSGIIGSSPAPSDQQRAYVLRTKGRLETVEDFENIVLRSEVSGAMVKLKDVAKVELGSESYTTSSTIDGISSAQILVFQNSNGNAIAISNECRALMKEFEKSFPPDLRAEMFYDSSSFVRKSVKDVVMTLFAAVVLVSLVSFIFLQSFRMALVPTLAVPVSIVGTFAGLYILGYSINLITLFGVILAIGIVVDDAIIVIENISRLLDSGKYTPAEAAEESMREITGAIVATTAVLLAMFVPITFISGITGEIFRQFGVTISIAVTLSAFNALTLSPALSAMILRKRDVDAQKKKFILFRLFDSVFNGSRSGYIKILRKLIIIVIPIVIAYIAFGYFVTHEYSKVPPGFVPTEDQGVFFGNIQLPPGTSLEETKKVLTKVENIIRKTPGVDRVMCLAGYNILDSIPASENILVIAMLDSSPSRASAGELAKMATYEVMAGVPEAEPMLFQIPPIPGIGMSDGFNFILMEQGATDPARLSKVLDNLLEKANRNPKLSEVYSTFRSDSPGWYLEIDREKAMQMGVSTSSINQALQGVVGFEYINQFNRFGQVYKVEIQGMSKYRDAAEKIYELHAKNSKGQMVRFASFAKLKRETVPSTLTRYNLALSAAIQGSAAKGYSSGEAMAEMEEIAKSLPEGMTYAWTDMSYQEQKSGSLIIYVFILALLFIYLFLSALYGSWLLPFSVIPMVAVSLGGAVLAVTLAGITNNIYTQIGVVLLFGMTCKTSILVINFAKDKYDSGSELTESALYAAELRFRAVLMTGFAFILGTLPLALAEGAGTLDQRAIGATVVGGMVALVFVGIWFIPLLFVMCEKILRAVFRSKRL